MTITTRPARSMRSGMRSHIPGVRARPGERDLVGGKTMDRWIHPGASNDPSSPPCPRERSITATKRQASSRPVGGASSRGLIMAAKKHVHDLPRPANRKGLYATIDRKAAKRGKRLAKADRQRSVPQSPDPIRWGIVGTANIARAQFLPACASAKQRPGTSWSPTATGPRPKAYATAHGIDQGIEKATAPHRVTRHRRRLRGPPQHASRRTHYQGAQSRQGGAVRKAAQRQPPRRTKRTCSTSPPPPARPLWEAFVFPFQAQHQRTNLA